MIQTEFAIAFDKALKEAQRLPLEEITPLNLTVSEAQKSSGEDTLICKIEVGNDGKRRLTMTPLFTAIIEYFQANQMSPEKEYTYFLKFILDMFEIKELTENNLLNLKTMLYLFEKNKDRQF